MAEIRDLNVIDDSNTDRFPEGQAGSTVNNGARAGEGIYARGFQDTIDTSRVSTGTAGAYAVTSNRVVQDQGQGVGYYGGFTITFEANHSNTGTATLNVNAMGAKAIVKRVDEVLGANDIKTGDYVTCIYRAASDNFQLKTVVQETIQRSEIQDQSFVYAADTSGAANAIVISPQPAPSAYASGQRWAVKLANAVTDATTMNVSGLGAVAVTKNSSEALESGDAVAGQHIILEYDGTGFQLLNPIAPTPLPPIPPIPPAFTEWGASPDQAIPGNGALITVAYSAFDPAITGDLKELNADLVCVTAEHGYTAGQIIPQATQYMGTGGTAITPRGLQIYYDDAAEQVYARIGQQGMNVLNASGTFGVLTLNRWALRFKAKR